MVTAPLGGLRFGRELPELPEYEVGQQGFGGGPITVVSKEIRRTWWRGTVWWGEADEVQMVWYEVQAEDGKKCWLPGNEIYTTRGTYI